MAKRGGVGSWMCSLEGDGGWRGERKESFRTRSGRSFQAKDSRDGKPDGSFAGTPEQAGGEQGEASGGGGSISEKSPRDPRRRREDGEGVGREGRSREEEERRGKVS